MLTEPKYSQFYSICLDRELASKVKEAITQILAASPQMDKHFKSSKTLSGKIECKITNSFYQARTAEANRNNSILPSAFIADEVGAFKDYANINAMKSGQLNVENPLMFLITTAYAEDQSIMLDELDYLKKIYNGTTPNERVFALLYYADEEHLWDNYGIEQANPLRIESNYQEIRNSREDALTKPKEREEYLCKHMNHFLPTNSGETYLSIDDVRKCKIDTYDWTGKGAFQLGCTFENVGYFNSSLVLREGATLKIDGDFSIYSGCRISVNKNATLELGSGYINYGANIACFERISIGNNVIISENVTIRDSDDHQIISQTHDVTKPIKIEDNVWIGLNVTILKGVTIGEGSIIAAGALVNKDVPPKSLVGGVPAQLIKQNVEWKI